MCGTLINSDSPIPQVEDAGMHVDEASAVHHAVSLNVQLKDKSNLI